MIGRCIRGTGIAVSSGSIVACSRAGVSVVRVHIGGRVAVVCVDCDGYGGTEMSFVFVQIDRRVKSSARLLVVHVCVGVCMYSGVSVVRVYAAAHILSPVVTTINSVAIVFTIAMTGIEGIFYVIIHPLTHRRSRCRYDHWQRHRCASHRHRQRNGH